ncbi:MAG: hypothetical protein QOJ69_1747 [Actinomycetota bacterium]|nr:hypothetical protein [Actinomycetota bacterium]
MFTANGRAVVVCVVAVGLSGVLGGAVGTWIVDHERPTEDDVRAAAHSLVPPGFTVTSEQLDAYKAYSFFGDKRYEVDVEVATGGRVDRLPAFSEQTRRAGWRTGGTGSSSFERDGIDGDYRVMGEESIVAVATRQVEPSRWPIATFAVSSAAVVGLGICLAWILVPGLRRRW